MTIKKVCVYCASSSQCDEAYLNSAFNLGETLALNSITTVYGGGAVGSMGKLADGSLSKNGKVIGIIPKFMVDLEWAHRKLSELIIVESLHERKKLMLENTDAAIALPGGTGTLEELLETISLKRLGLYLNPIILVNTRGYFNPLINLLENSIKERFMDSRHSQMWNVVDEPSEVISAIKEAPSWTNHAIQFATI